MEIIFVLMTCVAAAFVTVTFFVAVVFSVAICVDFAVATFTFYELSLSLATVLTLSIFFYVYGPRLIRAVRRYLLAREKRNLVKYKADLKRAMSMHERDWFYRSAAPKNLYDMENRLNETNTRLTEISKLNV